MSTWNKNGIKVEGFPPDLLEVGSHYQLAVYEQLSVTLDGVKHEVGAIEHVLQSALIEDGGNGKRNPVPHLTDAVHSVYVAKVPEPTTNAPAGAIPVRAASTLQTATEEDAGAGPARPRTLVEAVPAVEMLRAIGV